METPRTGSVKLVARRVNEDGTFVYELHALDIARPVTYALATLSAYSYLRERPWTTSREERLPEAKLYVAKNHGCRR
jgi:hypothetical protein